jgi:N-acetylglucosaminyl-diphospho-decaprenol L-rhamnosyltransferase
VTKHSHPNTQTDSPDISVVVVNYNTGYLLDRMFSALAAARGELQIQIIVIDNASQDDSVKILRSKCPDIELIENSTNVGFGRANNQALPLATGRYILLLNTDAFVSSDTLRKTIDYMDTHLGCGILGVKLVGENGELQPCCRYFPTPWNTFLTRTGLNRVFSGAQLVDDMDWDHSAIRECDWVPGCYYLVRRKVIDRIGLFDPRFFLYSEEVDHCRATRSEGWTVMFYPFTSVLHIGGESAKSYAPLTPSGHQILALQIESELLYFRKHYGLSGLLASVILTTWGDVYLATKGIFRWPSNGNTLGALRHLKTFLEVLVNTRLASRATR